MAEMNQDHGAIAALNEKVYSESARRYPAECSLIEEAVSASFSLYGSLSHDAKLDSRGQDLLAFFYRNCIYLSASYQLIRRGLLDPAGNNMRTVFETIIWQYAYLTDDGIYANYREMSALDGEKLMLIKSGKWSNTRERALENLRRKYSFQKMLKALYSKEHYERLFYSQYWAFCQKSHSSIFGINHNTPTMGMGTTLDSSVGELHGNLSAASLPLRREPDVLPQLLPACAQPGTDRLRPRRNQQGQQEHPPVLKPGPGHQGLAVPAQVQGGLRKWTGTRYSSFSTLLFP